MARRGAMLAVIELPRLAYADMSHVTLPDVIATNVAAYRYITGPTHLTDPNIRDLRVTLERDGVVLSQGQGSDAMGDPYRAYTWMTQQIAALGYELEPGMLMITGALGTVVDAKPGRYTAHYGALGDIQFTIADVH